MCVNNISKFYCNACIFMNARLWRVRQTNWNHKQFQILQESIENRKYQIGNTSIVYITDTYEIIIMLKHT